MDLHAQTTPPSCVLFVFGGPPIDLSPIESGVVSQPHIAGVGCVVLENQKWNASLYLAAASYLHRLWPEFTPC